MHFVLNTQRKKLPALRSRPLLPAALLQFIAREDRFGAHNYKPLPVVLSRGEVGQLVLSSYRLLSSVSPLGVMHKLPSEKVKGSISRAQD